MKKLRYALEAVLIVFVLTLFRLLPLDMASATGGWIGRKVGPHLGASRKAYKNLLRAFPEYEEAHYHRIIAGMWDNLGRIIAEYPHLQEIVNNRIELIDTDENITKLQQDDPAFFVSGHLANWEAGALALGLWPSTNAAQVYRAPNNPYVAKILRRFRSPEEKIITFAKSTGTRALMKHLKQGGHVGILIDQKYNQGIPVKFFGHDAMTSPAFAELGLKYRAHLIPTRFERLKGANFRLTLYPGMKLYEGTNTDKSPKDLIDEAHKYLEIWITERPEQWLWLHRRWESKRLEWLLNDGRDGN